MITLRFACGHAVEMPNELTEQPICPQCNEHRIQSVQAPAPRFSGSCSGPYVQKPTEEARMKVKS